MTGYRERRAVEVAIPAVEAVADIWPRDFVARASLALILVWTLAMPWSIATAETAMWLGAVLWGVAWVRREVDPSSAGLTGGAPGPAGDALGLVGAPMIGFWGVSLLSATLSRNPVESLWELREVFLFVAPLLTYAAFRRRERRAWGTRVFAAGLLISIAVGVGQVVAALSDGDGLSLQNRPDGPLGHYMTYAGMLMLGVPVLLLLRGSALVIIAARLLAAVAFGVIGLTMTRSAWLGGIAVLVVYVGSGMVKSRSANDEPRRNLAVYGITLVVGASIVGLLVLSLAGHELLFERGASIFSLESPTNKDRLAMAVTGLRVIAHYPVLGVGPGIMGKIYPAWVVPWAVKESNPHLHNNVLQIAAERGLVGLALWLWMMVAFAVGAWRVLRHSGPRGAGGPEARAALAALAGFMVMGAFEYNFSDSEVLMVLLFLLALPYAASAELGQEEG